MAEDRVKAGFWVQMALRMGQSDGRYGMVLKKGDPDAGGILVMLRGREAFRCCPRYERRMAAPPGCAAPGRATWIRRQRTPM